MFPLPFQVGGTQTPNSAFPSQLRYLLSFSSLPAIAYLGPLDSPLHVYIARTAKDLSEGYIQILGVPRCVSFLSEFSPSVSSLWQPQGSSSNSMPVIFCLSTNLHVDWGWGGTLRRKAKCSSHAVQFLSFSSLIPSSFCLLIFFQCLQVFVLYISSIFITYTSYSATSWV